MFEQNPMTGPGISSMTNHTVEIVIMLLVAAILGYLLGKSVMKKWKIRTEELEIDLAKTKSLLEQSQTELKACGEARASLERTRENLNIQIEDLEHKLAAAHQRITELEPPAKGKGASGGAPKEAKMALVDIPTAEIFDSAMASTLYGSAVTKDDLKIVEGIGPKLESVFQASGVKTWRQMADMSSEELSRILTSADERHAMHDTSTWPEQCRLADAGEWAALREYQDTLDAGRAE